jgi:hypothetical protein
MAVTGGEDDDASMGEKRVDPARLLLPVGVDVPELLTDPGTEAVDA